MARGRRGRMKDEPVGKAPKLFPGDRVPKTGYYRLDEGIHVKPVKERKRKARSSYKPGRLKKGKVVGRSRSR